VEKVTRGAWVIQPTSKSEAEKAVKRVEWVTRLTNQIEVFSAFRRTTGRGMFIVRLRSGWQKYQWSGTPDSPTVKEWHGRCGPVISEVDKKTGLSRPMGFRGGCGEE